MTAMNIIQKHKPVKVTVYSLDDGTSQLIVDKVTLKTFQKALKSVETRLKKYKKLPGCFVHFTKNVSIYIER